MIPLPPGCKVHYPIHIEVRGLTEEMIEWYRLVGGEVFKDTVWDNRGREQVKHRVRYGKGKFCYHRQDGSGGTRLHFDGADASAASMFLIKFLDDIEQHNFQEHLNQLEKQY
jgi:hypothetical protein